MQPTPQDGNGDPRVKGETPDLTSRDEYPHSVDAARLQRRFATGAPGRSVVERACRRSFGDGDTVLNRHE
jgi:hypothetical protein